MVTSLNNFIQDQTDASQRASVLLSPAESPQSGGTQATVVERDAKTRLLDELFSNHQLRVTADKNDPTDPLDLLFHEGNSLAMREWMILWNKTGHLKNPLYLLLREQNEWDGPALWSLYENGEPLFTLHEKSEPELAAKCRALMKDKENNILPVERFIDLYLEKEPSRAEALTVLTRLFTRHPDIRAHYKMHVINLLEKPVTTQAFPIIDKNTLSRLGRKTRAAILARQMVIFGLLTHPLDKKRLAAALDHSREQFRFYENQRFSPHYNDFIARYRIWCELMALGTWRLELDASPKHTPQKHTTQNMGQPA